MNTHNTTNDWPDPVSVVNLEGSSPLVLVCEHASNYIPPEYARLGLPKSELERHIALDIGAQAVTCLLSKLLDAPAFIANYSRLLIDLNRPLGAESSMPEKSEATHIPGNMSLANEERTRREERIWIPFHKRISAFMDSRQRNGQETRLLTVHSFTRCYLDEVRSVEIGIVSARAAAWGKQFAALLKAESNRNVIENEPYQIEVDSDYAIPVHGDNRGIDALLMEIRNDLIDSPAGVEGLTPQIAKALAPFA